jgi:hypothetical protein
MLAIRSVVSCDPYGVRPSDFVDRYDRQQGKSRKAQQHCGNSNCVSPEQPILAQNSRRPCAQSVSSDVEVLCEALAVEKFHPPEPAAREGDHALRFKGYGLDLDALSPSSISSRSANQEA